MLQQRSRLQLLDDLRLLNRELAGTNADGEFDALLERYSYGELQVIADFLTAYTERLHAAR